MINKNFITLFLIIFISAGCSSGSRFSKESLLTNTRLHSIDKSLSAQLPINWQLFEDNLNETVLFWFVSKDYNQSILVTPLNSNVTDLLTLSEITKTSKKQNNNYRKTSQTEIIAVDDKKASHFTLEGKEFQHVFIFQYKNKFYESTAITKITDENKKEELFYITQAVISSIK